MVYTSTTDRTRSKR